MRRKVISDQLISIHCFIYGLLKDAVNRHDCTMTHCQGTKLVFTVHESLLHTSPKNN